jgi:hypothetical protein
MENKNKLIAEFMGGKLISTEEYESPHGSRSTGIIENWKLPEKAPYSTTSKLGFFEYNKSWDWLMPVVEKIESLDLKEYGYQWEGIYGEIEYNNGSVRVEIERNECWIYMNLQLDPFHTFNEKTSHMKFDTKIEATYAAVVEFIEYYNNLIKQD